jgi:hypothetical protein
MFITMFRASLYVMGCRHRQAILATIVAGGRALIQLNIRLIKYIDFYINLTNQTRPPAPWAAWYHQIQAAGGASSAITMVVVFVGCLCCCGLTRDVTRSSYVKNGTKITLRRGYVG